MKRTGPSPAVLALVRARDGGFCLRCGIRRGVQCHHRVPRGMGGTHNPAVNKPQALVWVCLRCHLEIESERSEAYALGWLVRRNSCDDPSEIPLTDLDGGVFFLTEEGDVVQLASVLKERS